jgi:hypothetical protein
MAAWSAGIVLNDILDDAKPRIERVQVLGKETTGSDPDYELRLAAWGTFDEKDYEVSRKLYDKVQVGQEGLHPNLSRLAGLGKLLCAQL